MRIRDTLKETVHTHRNNKTSEELRKKFESGDL